ncbi:helix-turn-helix domain-containing protein [Actinoplanes utahensis]|uniref:HTH araC/xylS-type domain-containing protein n=1 Tax=Actinoplanes utahensis TaxID=1869 RepID=A0A0A6USN6_ACTUT|nr:helix-turn-helix transcriptional regulator [Actinoplanes utahensis]KHD77469.1 hypothetical protein MB27_10060 [Actinoplanes utahensis]GIF32594.1 hypothetical protein Aut01nite_55800 [Actinoplanes utahensis]
MDALGPWFSAVTIGAPLDLHRLPAVVEEPDHATVLTWRLGSAEPDDIVILGPRTRAGYRTVQPGRNCAQLRFRPGRAAELLGVPARELTDRAVPAADLDSEPLRDLVRRIVRTGPDADRLRTLARALPPAGPRDWRSRLVAEATALLPGERVGAVARRLNVSERHLRNLFADRVGLAPATYVRIDRLRIALAGMDRKLPALAAEAGYYDQSHMNADFRQLMGTTPHAFATGRWPAAATCSA